MKHPVRDRLLILLCALAALCGAAASVALVLGRFSLVPAIELFGRVNNNVAASLKIKAALIVLAVVLVLFAALLISAVLPAGKKRSSNFAYQQNENGMVRISLKALEALVQRCLNQHAELKVVTSSLYSDEESVRVDVHITLQSDISMPLAISALQKQIKRYLEACSGVTVKEVRVFVDGTTAANEETAKSPYAIPASLLGTGEARESALLMVDEVPADAAPVQVEAATDAAPVQVEAATDAAPQAEEQPDSAEEDETDEAAAAEGDAPEPQEETGDWA